MFGVDPVQWTLSFMGLRRRWESAGEDAPPYAGRPFGAGARQAAGHDREGLGVSESTLRLWRKQADLDRTQLGDIGDSSYLSHG